MDGETASFSQRAMRLTPGHWHPATGPQATGPPATREDAVP